MPIPVHAGEALNGTMDAIMKRRSIRKFEEGQVRDDDLEQMLDAGKWAPSGRNTQPWHFTVVESRAMLDKINETCRKWAMESGDSHMAERAKDPAFNAYHGAPMLIIVSGDRKDPLVQMNCAIALSFMMVAAESLGVGSCWVQSVIPALQSGTGAAIRGDMGIPDGYDLCCAAIFGYAEERPEPAARKEGTVSIIK